jgi:TonB family protein
MKMSWPFVLALFAVLAGPAQAQPRNLGLVSYKEPVVPKLEIDASAIVAFTIQANGRVDDAVTLSATNRVLGESARAAVLEWRFDRDPTYGRGRDASPSKVLRREIVEFVFKRDGIVTSMSHRDSAKAWFPPDYQTVVRLVQAEDLDPPLVRLARPTSEAARDLVQSLSVGGTVVVSFVVDEAGAVRVPIAVRAADETLTDAALALVGGWHYEPPTADGTAVIVEARETVIFPPRPD